MVKIKGVEIREQTPNIAKHMEEERIKKIKESRKKLGAVAEYLSRQINKKVTLGDLVEILSYTKSGKLKLKKDYEIICGLLMKQYGRRDLYTYEDYALNLHQLISKRFAK